MRRLIAFGSETECLTPEPQGPRSRKTGDIQLSWIHAHLRKDKEREVYGSSKDDATATGVSSESLLYSSGR